MDAKHTPRWAWPGILCIVGGCMLEPYQPPAARQERRPRPQPQREPPQVVETPSESEKPEPAEGVHQAVESYIERVDGVQERANRRESLESRYAGTVRQVKDERVDTQSAPEPGSVVVIPESVAGPAATRPAPDAQAQTPPPSPRDGAKPAAPSPAPAVRESPAPPVLLGVEVSAAPSIRATLAAREPTAPGVNQTAVARDVPSSFADYLKEMATTAADGSFREQLDLRVLWVVAGEYERAREPLAMASEAQQELATGFIDALIAIREGNLLGDEAAAATQAVRRLAKLQEALRRVSDLSLSPLKICSAVRGFGQYDLIEPAQFRTGGNAEFVLYCELRDFVSEQREDGYYYTTFDMTTTILNRAGDVVLEIKDPDIVDRCRNRRQDCFIPRLVRLPTSLSPGQYVAKVAIVDKLGQKVAENRGSFQMIARR